MTNEEFKKYHQEKNYEKFFEGARHFLLGYTCNTYVFGPYLVKEDLVQETLLELFPYMDRINPDNWRGYLIMCIRSRAFKKKVDCTQVERYPLDIYKELYISGEDGTEYDVMISDIERLIHSYKLPVYFSLEEENKLKKEALEFVKGKKEISEPAGILARRSIRKIVGSRYYVSSAKRYENCAAF